MRMAGTLVAPAAALVALTGTAHAFGSFPSRDTYTTGGAVYGVAVGDVNGDGKADVVAGNDNGDDHISILPGLGNGGLDDERSIADPDGPEGVAIGRFNSDRRPEFAVADYTTSRIRTYFRAGGDFNAGPVLDGVAGTWLLQRADLNRDGRLDLVAGNYDSDGSDPVSVFLGKGRKGRFKEAKSYAAGTGGAAGLALARMNRDRRPDVVVVTREGAVSVLRAKANGALGKAKTVEGASSYPGFDGLAAADFDRDGRADVAVSDYDANEIFLLRGKRDGSLGGPKPAGPSSLAGKGPWAIEARELTGDRRPDLVVAGYNTSEIFFLRPRKGGGFKQFDDHFLGDIPEFMTTGRLNRDKGADVVVGTDSGVDVLINEKSP